jgi:hypothetical protein
VRTFDEPQEILDAKLFIQITRFLEQHGSLAKHNDVPSGYLLVEVAMLYARFRKWTGYVTLELQMKLLAAVETLVNTIGIRLSWFAIMRVYRTMYYLDPRMVDFKPESAPDPDPIFELLVSPLMKDMHVNGAVRDYAKQTMSTFERKFVFFIMWNSKNTNDLQLRQQLLSWQANPQVWPEEPKIRLAFLKCPFDAL